MAGLQQTGTFAESILLRFLRLADCLLRVFSLRFQVIQLVAQQFLTTDSRNVGNEMWQGSFVAGGTLVHRPVPDSIPEPAFAGSMLRLQFVVSVLGPQIRPESGFASLGLHSISMSVCQSVCRIGHMSRWKSKRSSFTGCTCLGHYSRRNMTWQVLQPQQDPRSGSHTWALNSCWRQEWCCSC